MSSRIEQGTENPLAPTTDKYLEVIEGVTDVGLNNRLFRAIQILIPQYGERVLGPKEELALLINVFGLDYINKDNKSPMKKLYAQVFWLMQHKYMPKKIPTEERLSDVEGGENKPKGSEGYGPMQTLALVSFVHVSEKLIPHGTNNIAKSQAIQKNVAETQRRLGDSPLANLFPGQEEKSDEDIVTPDHEHGWEYYQGVFERVQKTSAVLRLVEPFSSSFLNKSGFGADVNLMKKIEQIIRAGAILSPEFFLPTIDAESIEGAERALHYFLACHSKNPGLSPRQILKRLAEKSEAERLQRRLAQ